MISPYLRRPLRSLDEMLTQERDAIPGGRVRAPATQAPVAQPTRAIDSASTDKESTIASNR